MTYYIIEHRTKGTFRCIEYDGHQAKARFSWSGMRSDPEKAYRIFSLKKAMDIQTRLTQMYPGQQFNVRKTPGPGEIEWKVVA